MVWVEPVSEAEKGCGEQAGNPIVVPTGNKVESFLDFSGAGERGLYLRRTYNHYWTYAGLFGRHWVSSFDYSLVPPQANNTVWAQRPDGRRIKYLWKAATQRYEEDKAASIAYIVYGPGGSFIHHAEDNAVETYDPNGYVQTLKNRQGIGWTFAYSANYLQSVTHTSGRSVQFTWTDAGSGHRLTGITTGGGYQLDYDYDANDRLTELIHGTIPNATQAYGYDALDRLHTVTSGLGNQGFIFDANGNRQSHTHSTITSSYTTAPTSNRISAISGGLSRSYSARPTGQPRGGICNPTRSD